MAKTLAHQAIYLALMWVIHFINWEVYGGGLNRYGLYSGVGGIYLVGIITHPFLHGDWGHLIGNTIAYIPLSILCWRNFTFVFWFCVFLGGFITWVITPLGVVSVGASGVIYGLWSYLIVRSLPVLISTFNKPSLKGFGHLILIAITSYLTVEYFGSLWSGMVPGLVPRGVSWQGHLAGAFAGVVAAFVKPLEQQPKNKNLSLLS